MQTLLSISDILNSGNIYMDDIYNDTTELEIEVGDFFLSGKLELEIKETKDSNESGSWIDEEVISQKFTLKYIYNNEECEEVEVTKSDVDVVNAWFQQFKIELSSK